MDLSSSSREALTSPSPSISTSSSASPAPSRRIAVSSTVGSVASSPSSAAQPLLGAILLFMPIPQRPLPTTSETPSSSEVASLVHSLSVSCLMAASKTMTRSCALLARPDRSLMMPHGSVASLHRSISVIRWAGAACTSRQASFSTQSHSTVSWTSSSTSLPSPSEATFQLGTPGIDFGFQFTLSTYLLEVRSRSRSRSSARSSTLPLVPRVSPFHSVPSSTFSVEQHSSLRLLFHWSYMTQPMASRWEMLSLSTYLLVVLSSWMSLTPARTQISTDGWYTTVFVPRWKCPFHFRRFQSRPKFHWSARHHRFTRHHSSARYHRSTRHHSSTRNNWRIRRFRGVYCCCNRWLQQPRYMDWRRRPHWRLCDYNPCWHRGHILWSHHRHQHSNIHHRWIFHHRLGRRWLHLLLLYQHHHRLHRHLPDG